ncbi:MAG: hypothetical protein QOE92_2487 [Chloroflexota bacterium]|nr:hypothetical protein [Chloroflexota bacterium]
MSESSWDSYSSDAADTTADAASAEETPAAVTEAQASVEAAAAAADWGEWNEAIGDAAAADVQSNLDAAQVAAAEGFDDLADLELSNAATSADVAANHYSTAADDYGTAAGDLTDASADLASADVSSATVDTTDYSASVEE